MSVRATGEVRPERSVRATQKMHGRPLLIVGVGSPHGDDQAGWLAVDRLRPHLPVEVVAHKASGGLDLLSLLEGHEELIVVDASAPAGHAGMLRTLEWPCPELADSPALSTHGMSLVESLRIAELLGCLPQRVSLYTIEANAASPGESVSDPVALALEKLVPLVLTDVKRRLPPADLVPSAE